MAPFSGPIKRYQCDGRAAKTSRKEARAGFAGGGLPPTRAPTPRQRTGGHAGALRGIQRAGGGGSKVPWDRSPRARLRPRL